MRLRAPVQADAPAVSAVLTAREMSDLGVRHHTPADLRDEWRASALDLAADARVVESADGTIVGYAVVRPTGALAVVHPDREGRGIGTRLLEWVERGERERRHERHRQWVAAGNVRARALLTGAGYEVARSYCGMACSLDGARAVARSPGDGVRVRSVDVQRDAARLHQLNAAIIAGNPSYVAESLREYREEHLEAHDTESRWGLVAPSLDQRVTDSILGLMATGTEQAGWVGYRLAAMFGQAGLGDVRSSTGDHTLGDPDDFFAFTHLHGLADGAARSGAVTQEEATAWLASLRDLLARGEAFAMVLVLHVAGVKLA